MCVRQLLGIMVSCKSIMILIQKHRAMTNNEISYLQLDNLLKEHSSNLIAMGPVYVY